MNPKQPKPQATPQIGAKEPHPPVGTESSAEATAMQVGGPVGVTPEPDVAELGVNSARVMSTEEVALRSVLVNLSLMESQGIHLGGYGQNAKDAAESALAKMAARGPADAQRIPRVLLVQSDDGVELASDQPIDLIQFNFMRSTDGYVAPSATRWAPMPSFRFEEHVRDTKAEHDAEYPGQSDGSLTADSLLEVAGTKVPTSHEASQVALAARHEALFGDGTHEEAAKANRAAAAIARDASDHAAITGDKKVYAQRAKEHEEIAADHDRMAKEAAPGHRPEATTADDISTVKAQREDLRRKFIDLQVQIGDLIPPIEGERANDPMIRRVERQTAQLKAVEAKVKILDEAATNLVRTFVNGTHYGTQNPYSRAAVKAAMMALAEVHGRNPDNWMDAVNGGKDEVLKGLPEGIHPRNRAAIGTALEGEREVFVLKSSPDTFAALVEAVVAEGEGVTDDGFVVIKDGFKNPLWGHAWTESMGLDSARYIKRLPEPYVKKALAREEKFKG